MAFSSTLIRRNNRQAIFDLTATDNADVGGNVAHGLERTPVKVAITPLLAVAYDSQWIVAGIDATNVAVAKTAGSGADADPQARLIIEYMDDIEG